MYCSILVASGRSVLYTHDPTGAAYTLSRSENVSDSSQGACHGATSISDRNFPIGLRPQGDLYERRLGAQEQRYETDFFLQRQTMHVAVPQCMLRMSVVLVHDKYLTITVSLAISPSILPVKAYESASS